MDTSEIISYKAVILPPPAGLPSPMSWSTFSRGRVDQNCKMTRLLSLVLQALKEGLKRPPPSAKPPFCMVRKTVATAGGAGRIRRESRSRSCSRSRSPRARWCTRAHSTRPLLAAATSGHSSANL